MAGRMLVSVWMEKIVGLVVSLLVGCVMQSCVAPPAPDPVAPSKATRQVVLERVSAVVVTERDNLDRWVNRNFTTSQDPGDADGGSAAPISPDGYFLTADHVLARASGRNVFVIFGQGGGLVPRKCRVVWRSKSSDLALLHVATRTPYYYQWSSPGKWVPAGTLVIHGGIATGHRSGEGRLGTSLNPENGLTRNRAFKMDIPLQPGDSGGPVVDAYGRLIGINSAVEFLVPMETAFFIDSEGNRPNTRMIDALVRNDRMRNQKPFAGGPL